MRRWEVIFFSLCVSCAQGQVSDTLVNGAPLSQDGLVSVYYSRLDSLSLYNGRQFYGYPDFIEGDAFFPNRDWNRGDLLYDGAWYHDVAMLYDVYKDGLIVKHPAGLTMQLFSERLQEFSMGGKTFVYLRGNKENVISEGIYQLLANGKVKVYAKRKKLLFEEIRLSQLERKFIVADRFFIFKDGQYHAVKRQKELLNLFKDKSREIKDYKRQLHLKFRTNAEQLIVALANYYNQLQRPHEK